jgi:hypothetical protein
MIKIKPLIYANGPAAFGEYLESTSPITGNGNIPGGYVFKRAVNWWKLVIYVSAVSGTSPSLTFNLGVDNMTGPQTYYILPAITSPVIYEILQTPTGKLVLTQKNTSSDIISQQTLGYGWGAMGMYLIWSVSGTSPSFSVSAYLIYEDGGEE